MASWLLNEGDYVKPELSGKGGNTHAARGTRSMGIDMEGGASQITKTETFQVALFCKYRNGVQDSRVCKHVHQGRAKKEVRRIIYEDEATPIYGRYLSFTITSYKESEDISLK